MTLVPTNPIIIDGETYPLYSANLAIAAKYINGELNASAAMRLVPTRIDADGNTITADDYTRSLTLGSTSNISGPEAEVMIRFHNAIQTYIFEKGL